MVAVRQAVPQDYDGLCAVIKDTDGFHADAMPVFFRRYQGPARTHEWFSGALDNPDSRLLVAEQNGVIVGFLWALVRHTPELSLIVPRRFLVVDMVGVAEAQRGQSIGHALMAHVHDWARSQGITQVELTVWEFNQRAIAFYEELGYTAVQRRMWKGLE